MQTKRDKPHSPRSLAFTLTLSLAIFSIVTLLASQSVQYTLSLQTQNTALTNQQQLVAQEAGGTVASSIQEKFSVLETAVEFGDPGTASAEARQTILDDLVGLQPSFRQLALLNSSGMQVASVTRISSTLSQQFQTQLKGDLFAQTKAGQRYISPVYIDELTSEPLVAMAVPALNVFGDFEGALVAELNLKFMWDLVDQLKVGETGYVYVVDNQGKLIASQDTARVLRGDNVSQIPEVKEFIQNPSATADISPEVSTYTGLNGEPVVGTYLPLGAPQWAVVIELPDQEAFRQGRIQATWTIASALVIAILAAWIGRYYARRIAAPLIDLSGVASEIAGGNLSREAKAAGPSEIAQVATAFNAMTRQLRDLIGTLEQRVADRTKALVASAEVSRRLSTILDEDQLVREVVEEVQSHFNYYHVHIYLLDQARQELVMAGGTGEPGRIMLAQGRRIPVGKGMVGRAAETNTPMLASDVTQNPDWLPNPLLPETKAETAVPISFGGEALGVLDVQHNVIGGLKQEDTDLLQAIGTQIAIALRNTRSYRHIEDRVERDELIASINQKIQGTTTVENALQVAVREVGRAFSAHASVRLAQSDQRTDHK